MLLLHFVWNTQYYFYLYEILRLLSMLTLSQSNVYMCII